MDDDDYQYGDLGEDDDFFPPKSRKTFQVKEKLKQLLNPRFGD